MRTEPLSILIIIKNGRDLMAAEGVKMVASLFTIPLMCGVLIVIGIVYVLNKKTNFFFYSRPSQSRKLAIVGLMALFAVEWVVPSRQTNEFTAFAKSIKQYFKPTTLALPRVGRDELFPYYNKPDSTTTSLENRPHVFFVMLESFSAEYLDRIENGKRVTPLLDSLMNEGYYIENFFSNSIETAKGQFTTLCSSYPSYRSNVFTRYYENNFRCLPEILQEYGYSTVFLKAYHSLKFENTGEFVKHNGFDHYYGMDRRFISQEEIDKYYFGWGVQDNVFYEKTFWILDSLRALQDTVKPFFVTTMSVTNHMMFKSIPKEQKYIYPNAKDKNEENYANSIHLTDKYLREFFIQLNKREYLDNSIVFVFGDNGFPMGQHQDNYYNTKTAYNEMFKTGLLITGKNIKPQKITGKAFSQVDLGPTVLDMIGLQVDNSFVGQSILSETDSNHFIPLVQPFDGTIIGSIRYPHKLLYKMAHNEFEYFNLEKDPGELKGYYSDDIPLLGELKEDIQRIFDNEVLLEENRIAPVKEAFKNVLLRVDSLRIDEGEDLIIHVMGDVNDDYAIEAQIQNVDYLTYTIDTNLVELGLDEQTSVIPARYLKKGINKIHLTVKHLNNIASEKIISAFVDNDEVDLLTSIEFEGRQSWGKPVLNRSVRNNELKINNEAFRFGFGTHADSYLKFNLNGSYNFFAVGMGIDDQALCGNGALFRILGDGELLFQSDMIPNRVYKDTLVNISSVQELRLETKRGVNGRCDHTNWVNPVLVRTDMDLKYFSNSAAIGKDYVVDEDAVINFREALDELDVKLTLNGNETDEYTIEERILVLDKSKLSGGRNDITLELLYDNERVLLRKFILFNARKDITFLDSLPITGKQDWGVFARSKSVLRRRMVVNGKEYKFGLGTHANSVMKVELNGKFQTFKGSVGMDDESICGDGAIFKIMHKHDVLYDSGVVPYKTVKNFKVNVSGLNAINLVTEQGRNRPCDHTNWLDAYFE